MMRSESRSSRALRSLWLVGVMVACLVINLDLALFHSPAPVAVIGLVCVSFWLGYRWDMDP